MLYTVYCILCNLYYMISGWMEGDRLSWHLFHDLHSSYIVAAAIGASASGCTLGAATYNVPDGCVRALPLPSPQWQSCSRCGSCSSFVKVGQPLTRPGSRIGEARCRHTRMLWSRPFLYVMTSGPKRSEKPSRRPSRRATAG